MKTQEQIDSIIDEASDLINEESNRFPAMTYEEGVRTALEWVMSDDDDESPLD